MSCLRLKKSDLRRQLAEEVRCRKYAEHRLYEIGQQLTTETDAHTRTILALGKALSRIKQLEEGSHDQSPTRTA